MDEEQRIPWWCSECGDSGFDDGSAKYCGVCAGDSGRSVRISRVRPADDEDARLLAELGPKAIAFIARVDKGELDVQLRKATIYSGETVTTYWDFAAAARALALHRESRSS